MARITVEDCIDKFPSRFELVLIASNRARKLHSGESTTLEKDNDKNTVIALREIAEETITIDVLKNDLIDRINAFEEFGLRFNEDSGEWVVITSANLSSSNTFSLTNAGDSTATNLDASWFYKFTNDGNKSALPIVTTFGLNPCWAA